MQILATLRDERGAWLPDLFRAGDYRWAIYDRKTKTLWFGPDDVHIHLTVAEQSGVLRNPPDYYRPGANVLGGYLCRSMDGDFYFDPYSGTFPGTEDGVRDAEQTLRSVCASRGMPFVEFALVAPERRANCKLTRGS